MALMTNNQTPMASAPVSDGGGTGYQPSPGMTFGPQGPQSQAMQAAGQIRQMEMQLMETQRRYGLMSTMTNNPQQLFAMQSEIQKLQQQIDWAKQSAQQAAAMSALKLQQEAQARGSMGISNRGGQGGVPNQGLLDRSQQVGLLTNMFAGSSGSPYRNY